MSIALLCWLGKQNDASSHEVIFFLLEFMIQIKLQVRSFLNKSEISLLNKVHSKRYIKKFSPEVQLQGPFCNPNIRQALF